MRIATVTTNDGTLLQAVRETLAGGDELLLCVAFAQLRGVQLIRKELELAAGKARAPRLLVTTALGSSSDEALALAKDAGAEVRVLNPGGATYHPKVYLARGARTAAAVIGSANLTSGLVVNVEAAMHLRGKPSERALDDAWRWAEAMWTDPRTKAWTPSRAIVGTEGIDPTLLRLLRKAVADDPVFYTLSQQAPNRVAELTASGVYVETKRSKQKSAHPELVPPWIINLAWEVLQTRGELTNKHLLEELRVHRSSAVLAILRRLPGVSAMAGRRVGLRWRRGSPNVPPKT